MKSIQILCLRFAEVLPSNGGDMILTTLTIELPQNDARNKKPHFLLEQNSLYTNSQEDRWNVTRVPAQYQTNEVKRKITKTPDLKKKIPRILLVEFTIEYHQKFAHWRRTLFILKWNIMLIKQIYKFLQYFELVADVYKRIPAV